MKKYFTFDTTNKLISIKSMDNLFDGLPFSAIADSKILGILIIASALGNSVDCKILLETLRLIGYAVRAQIDNDINLTICNNDVYIQIVNNETAIWTKED